MGKILLNNIHLPIILGFFLLAKLDKIIMEGKFFLFVKIVLLYPIQKFLVKLICFNRLRYIVFNAILM